MGSNFQPNDDNTKLAKEAFEAYVKLLKAMKKGGGACGKEAEKQLKYFEPLEAIADAYEIGRGLAEAADKVRSELQGIEDAGAAASIYAGSEDSGPAAADGDRAKIRMLASKVISIDKGSVFGHWVEEGDAPFYVKMIYLWKTHDYKIKPAAAVQYLIDLAGD